MLKHQGFSPQLSHRSTFERLPLTGESAVGSLLIIQPQRGRVTEGDALIVIGQLWTPAPPTCKRGQRSNKSSQAQQGRERDSHGVGGREGAGCRRRRGEIPHPVLLRWTSALHGGILVLFALSISPLVPPGLAFSPSQVGP
ncbi:hypothetical protein EYF80_037074 [Liparis tanakae]|uniref:Uncharacterized protein n=1 Tax=Liparis tanakae TaxID=230148 RepID=A0A4Z2GIT2_9TELE|nr:hypothetical protein EYF80_037074 [Liparis tanakae]